MITSGPTDGWVNPVATAGPRPTTIPAEARTARTPATPARSGDAGMSGAIGMDAKQCRERALRCTELAERATDPQLKAVLTTIAERWLKAAAELEGSQVSQDEPKDQ